MSHTSPECLENCDRKLNEPTQPPIAFDFEQEAIASVISQRNCELEQNRLNQYTDAMLGQPVSRPNSRAASIVSPESECATSNIQQQGLLCIALRNTCMKIIFFL